MRTKTVAEKLLLKPDPTVWSSPASRLDSGAYGMRPIGQVAVDEVWSAMRFRPNRPGEAPFVGGDKR